MIRIQVRTLAGTSGSLPVDSAVGLREAHLMLLQAWHDKYLPAIQSHLTAAGICIQSERGKLITDEVQHEYLHEHIDFGFPHCLLVLSNDQWVTRLRTLLLGVTNDAKTAYKTINLAATLDRRKELRDLTEKIYIEITRRIWDGASALVGEPSSNAYPQAFFFPAEATVEGSIGPTWASSGHRNEWYVDVSHDRWGPYTVEEAIDIFFDGVRPTPVRSMADFPFDKYQCHLAQREKEREAQPHSKKGDSGNNLYGRSTGYCAERSHHESGLFTDSGNEPQHQ